MEAKSDVVGEIASLKNRIARQQKIVGDLERRGLRHQARGARFELYQMLNRMDALEFSLTESVRTSLSPSRSKLGIRRDRRCHEHKAASAWPMGPAAGSLRVEGRKEAFEKSTSYGPEH
jgi:hypothetical protein